jgi:hypothetical protein
MSLKAKINKARRLKAELQQLERDIVELGFAKMQQPGQTLLMKPRIERVMQLYG